MKHVNSAEGAEEEKPTPSPFSRSVSLEKKIGQRGELSIPEGSALQQPTRLRVPLLALQVQLAQALHSLPSSLPFSSPSLTRKGVVWHPHLKEAPPVNGNQDKELKVEPPNRALDCLTHVIIVEFRMQLGRHLL
jgi:hypothetical protein